MGGFLTSAVTTKSSPRRQTQVTWKISWRASNHWNWKRRLAGQLTWWVIVCFQCYFPDLPYLNWINGLNQGKLFRKTHGFPAKLSGFLWFSSSSSLEPILWLNQKSSKIRSPWTWLWLKGDISNRKQGKGGRCAAGDVDLRGIASSKKGKIMENPSKMMCIKVFIHRFEDDQRANKKPPAITQHQWDWTMPMSYWIDGFKTRFSTPVSLHGSREQILQNLNITPGTSRDTMLRVSTSPSLEASEADEEAQPVCHSYHSSVFSGWHEDTWGSLIIEIAILMICWWFFSIFDGIRMMEIPISDSMGLFVDGFFTWDLSRFMEIPWDSNKKTLQAAEASLAFQVAQLVSLAWTLGLGRLKTSWSFSAVRVCHSMSEWQGCQGWHRVWKISEHTMTFDHGKSWPLFFWTDWRVFYGQWPDQNTFFVRSRSLHPWRKTQE